jgi:hypothetical protein
MTNSPNKFTKQKTAVLQRLQQNELYLLLKLRGVHFDTGIQEAGINKNRLYAPNRLGKIVGMTVAEDFYFATNALGRRPKTFKRKGRHTTLSAAQFPKLLAPGTETKLETKRRRRQFRAPARNAVGRAKRAKAKMKAAIMQNLVNTLDDRASALWAVLRDGKDMTVGDLMTELARCPAFRDPLGSDFLKDSSLRKAIIRELRRPPLAKAIRVTEHPRVQGIAALVARRIGGNTSMGHGTMGQDAKQHRTNPCGTGTSSMSAAQPERDATPVCNDVHATLH